MACKGITCLSIYSSEMDSGGSGGGEGKVRVSSAKAPKEKKRVMYANVGILCLFRADGLNFRKKMGLFHRLFQGNGGGGGRG